MLSQLTSSSWVDSDQSLRPVTTTETSATIPAPPSPVTILPTITCHNSVPVPLQSCKLLWFKVSTRYPQCIRKNTADAEERVRDNQWNLATICITQLAVLLSSVRTDSEKLGFYVHPAIHCSQRDFAYHGQRNTVS